MLTGGEFTATLNGLDLWFKISGQGPPCILPTPGWGPSADLYFPTLTPLERNLTMIYLDTRGSGRSQKPLHATEFTLAHFSADIHSLRHYLGLQTAWIMGHSRGGVHALHYALHYPTSCVGMILLDPMAERDQDWRTDLRTRMVQRRNEPWYERAKKAWDDETVPKDDDAFAQNMRDCLEFYFSDATNIQGASAAFSATTFSVAALHGARDSLTGEFGLLDRLAQIRMPTLIIVGEDDFICSPLQADRLHRRIAGSTLRVLPKAGHFPWLERPDEFFPIVFEFLVQQGIS